MPSLLESFISSSWLPSPGCVWREYSYTSCSLRSLRANTLEKSTTMCRGTSSRQSWSASQQPSTTAATGPTKRKCSCLTHILWKAKLTYWMLRCIESTCCVCVRQILKRNQLIISCQHLMRCPWRLHRNIQASFLPGMGSCSIFHVIWKWLTDPTLWFHQRVQLH